MQQINLYLAEFRPNREPLRAVHMLWAAGAFFIILLLVSAYTYHQNQQLQEELVHERQLQQILQAKVQTLSAQKPAQASAALDEKIHKMQKEIERRQQILAMISSQNFGNDKGFSAQLNALAQASLETVSIETFSLQDGGSYAELSGKARSADQIPLYLQRLRNDPSFAKVGFGVLNVSRDKNNAGLMSFTIARFVSKDKSGNTVADTSNPVNHVLKTAGHDAAPMVTNAPEISAVQHRDIQSDKAAGDK